MVFVANSRNYLDWDVLIPSDVAHFQTHTVAHTTSKNL